MGMCDYRTEQFEIPKGKYQYEVARDDDRGADPAIVTSTVDRMVCYGWGRGILYGCKNSWTYWHL